MEIFRISESVSGTVQLIVSTGPVAALIQYLQNEALVNDSGESWNWEFEVEKVRNQGTIVLVCAGGCGKTTEEVGPHEFWQGEVKQSPDPECLVPIWTCRECKEKISFLRIAKEGVRHDGFN